MLFSDFIPEEKNEVSIYFQGQLIKVHLVELESLGHPFHLLLFHGCCMFMFIIKYAYTDLES